MAIGISLLPDPKPKQPSDPDPERKRCGRAVERVVFDPRIYPQTLRPTDCDIEINDTEIHRPSDPDLERKISGPFV